jgi:type VI secretion system secreted protein VgrG
MMPTTTERIELVTPLGDELLFHGLHAQEEMSRLGEYHLDLLSKNKNVDRDKILGAKVSIKVMLENDKVRYFNGFVSRFSRGAGLGRYARYYAVVKPWLWFLTRTSDCRIFQDKNVKQIVEDVFADHPQLADFAFELSEDYHAYKYCVQYRETDFNFVSRLLEHEGIYYYFRHTDGHHTLVMTDSVDKHDPFPGYETLKFIPPQILVKPGVEHINAWDITREVQPGVYAHDDYDFERPSVDLTTTKTLPRNYTPSNYEVYDYPGFYMQKPDGQHYAHVRIDEFGAQFETAQVTTNYRGVSVGATFDLEAQPEENEHLNGKYLVIGATHSLEGTQYESGDTGGGAFRCSFTALSCDQQFRPRRVTPKPFVQGPQTAVVVGPAGDEIYTDKYGRVKVQFHWDRRGKKDENSSCWVRVSHPWAGKGWGSVSTPRIGQEVIVDFLEGDPDQPIITGRVYNEENQPPFGFPAGAVISGVKSDTHKGSGFNEVSLDDTAGKERVFIHGQYNMDTVVEHDQTTTIHNCRTDRVDVDDSESIGNNQKWDVGVNRDAKIGSNETLTVGSNRTKKIGANEAITVGSNRDASIGASESLTVKLQRTHTVGVNETITVGGAQEITIGGLQAVTVGAVQTIKVGVNQSTSVGKAQSTSVGAARSISVGAAQTTSVKANASMSIGGDEKRSVTGARTTSIGKDDALKVSKNRSADVSENDTHKAGKTITLDAGDKVLIQAKNEIKLTVGQASMVMKKNGNIEITGMKIDIKGSQSVKQEAAQITSDASAVNTIKGGLVKIN